MKLCLEVLCLENTEHEVHTSYLHELPTSRIAYQREKNQMHIRILVNVKCSHIYINLSYSNVVFEIIEVNI